MLLEERGSGKGCCAGSISSDGAVPRPHKRRARVSARTRSAAQPKIRRCAHSRCRMTIVARPVEPADNVLVAYAARTAPSLLMEPGATATYTASTPSSTSRRTGLRSISSSGTSATRDGRNQQRTAAIRLRIAFERRDLFQRPPAVLAPA